MANAISDASKSAKADLGNILDEEIQKKGRLQQYQNSVQKYG